MQQVYQAHLSNIKLVYGNLQFANQASEDLQGKKKSNLHFYEFQNKGMGIILIKQNYKHLFYDHSKKLELPIREMKFKFYDVKKQNWLLNLSLKGDSVTLDIPDEEKGFHKTVQIKNLLFPTQDNAPFMLQKKIWIQINKLINFISVSTGDISGLEQQNLLQHKFEDVNGRKDTWKNEAQKFYMPDYQKQLIPRAYSKSDSTLSKVKYFTLDINVCEKGDCKTKQRIDDFLVVKLFDAGKIFDATLQKNPSLLKSDVGILEAMPKPLKILYNYLQNLNLINLPDYDQDPRDYKQKKGYSEWKDFQFAVQHSLMTPFGYTFDKKPIGILNHLYKMKLQKQYQALNINPKLGQTFQTKEDILKHIFTKRCGYIRLQMLPHEGLGPGSIAVLEIWPPYHSSSIHNHGQAYGLIKVLSGSIRVQNFSQLSFDTLEKQPYQQNDYIQDQFTWLSQQSFGIHRLINVHPQVCITLQAYYHNQNTTQYFSVVKQIDNEKVYIEYYPQNDWKNYLNLVNEKIDQKSFYKKEDIQFIQNIINTYELQEFNEINSQFHKLALILKEEYEYVNKFTLNLSKNQYLPKTEAQNIIYWVDDKPQQNKEIIDELLHKGIEVITIKSTQHVIKLFDKSLKEIKELKKRIIFISNMTRMEDKGLNEYAGVELFQAVTKTAKLEVKCIAFVGDVKKAKEKLKQFKTIQIVNSRQSLVKSIHKQINNIR